MNWQLERWLGGAKPQRTESGCREPHVSLKAATKCTMRKCTERCRGGWREADILDVGFGGGMRPPCHAKWERLCKAFV